MLNITDHTPGCQCRLHFNDAARRFDPTGTTSIRKRFEADLVRRFKRLRRLIIEAVAENDALGLAPKNRLQVRLGDQAPPRGSFAFARSDQKVQLFMSWLREEQARGILEIQPGASIESAAANAWTNTYIDSSYRKGIRDAGRKLREGGAAVAESWTESFFNRPIHADRVGLIYTRTFSDLKGITDAMDSQISRILAEGIANGQGPMQMAREMANRIDKRFITRARVIARTEVIKAHADATLNAYTEAGIEGVEVEAEFTTAGDSAVCEECFSLEGKTYTIAESRGIIPVHPNCLPGDALVLSRSGISAVTKREFNGDLIVIKTASGRSISCTPNHPILTSRGWVPAQLIDLQSKVICDGGSEWKSVADGNNDNIVSSIHDVAESFLSSSEVSTVPVPTTSEHFHGDGIDGQVAIIGANRSLFSAKNTAGGKCAKYGFFQLGGGRLSSLLAFGPSAQIFMRSLFASNRIMRGLNLIRSFVLAHCRPFGSLCFGLGSRLYSGFNNQPINSFSVEPKAVRNALSRFPSQVSGGDLFSPEAGKLELVSVLTAENADDDLVRDAILAAKLCSGQSGDVFEDQVISVDREFFSGHVYNLETGEGWYSANGIITHNCRCSWSPKVVNGTGIELR